MEEELASQEEIQRPVETVGIDLNHVFLVVARRIKVVLLATALGGIVGALIAFLIPDAFTASALILPPAKPQSIASAMIGQLGGMAGSLAPSLGLKDAGELYIGIMKSRSVVDELIEQFKLQQVYRTPTKEATRRKLLSAASFSSGRESLIKISVHDHDAKLAGRVANAFISALNKQNSRLAISESAQRRLFFEREVEAETTALTKAENVLRETELRTGVVEVSGQAQAVIASIAEMRGGIAMREVSLQRLRMGATPQNSEVVRQEAELSSFKSELAKLEAGGSRHRSGDPLVPVTNMPKAGLDYMRSLRDVKYHEALFEVLSKQYETARIDEAKEAPVIQVIDYAETPELRSGPPRMLISITGAFIAGIAGIAFALARARLDNGELFS